MKKVIFKLLFILFPFIAFAQADAPVFEDFVVKAKTMRSFILNNNVNIVTANLKGNVTEVSAVNDRMQVLWRVKLAGYGLATGLFKEKVFAITATEHTLAHGNSNTYDGFIINPLNGKIMVQKVVYDGDKDKAEEPRFFSAKDGSFLKLITRKTDMTRKPGFFEAYGQAFGNDGSKDTKSVNVIDFDENLFQQNPISLTLNSGSLFDIDCNYTGSVFLSWSKDRGVVEVEKFEPGKTTRSAMISVPFDVRDNLKAKEFDSSVQVISSSMDQNVVYLAATHQDQEKDIELSVAKVNFANNTQQVKEEKIDRDALKQIEKSYVVFNKKVDKPDVGNKRNMGIRFMDENNGNLVVSMSARFTQSSTISTGGYWIIAQSPIVSVYGPDLKLKARQLIPANFTITSNGYKAPAVVYFLTGGRLYYVANAKTGMTTFTALYGVINLENGQYIKQEYLSKKHINNSSYAENAVMWFGNSFIVPYTALSSMFQIGDLNMDYTLQHNTY